MLRLPRPGLCQLKVGQERLESCSSRTYQIAVLPVTMKKSELVIVDHRGVISSHGPMK